MSFHRVQPPFPSFTWVITAGLGNANVDGNLRLPAYRTSHLGRYHPYPRTRRSVREDANMMTVDYRFDDPPQPMPPSVNVPEAVVEEPGEDVKPAPPSPSSDEAPVNKADPPAARRQALKLLAQNVNAFLAALARTCRIAKAKKDVDDTAGLTPTD